MREIKLNLALQRDIKFIFCYINFKGTQAVHAEQCVAVSSQCCGINFNL